jgi:hypothetical protein
MSNALKINVGSNVLVGVVTIKQAKKDVKWAIKIVKTEEIFMFYHLKPWQS